MVEVFSDGWYQKSIFQRHEASPVLSVEFIHDGFDYNSYSLTWLELSRRPPVAEGIGESFCCFFVWQSKINANLNYFNVRGLLITFKILNHNYCDSLHAITATSIILNCPHTHIHTRF